MIQIQTKNFNVSLINLVDCSKQDLLYVLKLRNHPDVRKWMYNQHEIIESEHLNFIKKLKKSNENEYFLVKKFKQILGVIYFNKIDRIKKTLFFGFYSNVFDPAPGCGRILEEASLFYAFNFLNSDKIFLEVFADNKIVINLHRKYNFKINDYKKKNNFNILTMSKNL